MLEPNSQAKKIVSVVLIALLVISVGMVFGCAKKAEETIKIGAIYPLTGSLATTGADVKNGVLLAVDIINNEYNLDIPLARSEGIDSLNGAKIETIFGDSQGSPSVGKSEARRLILGEKAVALIGCYQSAVTAEASQVAEDEEIPFLTAVSTAPSLTQRGLKWFFRTTPNEKTFVQNFYEFLQDVQDEKGIKVENLGIVCENSIWGVEVGEYAEQYAGEYGYQVVETISYPSDTTNVSNEVQKLKDARPDVVIQASYINDAILYMQAYKEMKFKPDAILANDAGFIEPEFLKTLRGDGNYILTRETWSEDLVEAKPLVGTVNQMFRERYRTDMNGNSARAFTGILVLADAINRAGSTDPGAIREALLETNIPGNDLIMPWNGVKFDQETHQNTLGNGIICQIIDQEYYTVWPGKLAAKDLIWPMPRWEEREPAKVAMIFDTSGLENDFNKGCLLGAEKAESELGIRLDYVVVKGTTEFESMQRQYAESGKYALIVCIGSTQTSALVKVAADFPEQKFAIIDGTIASKLNIASFLFRDDESSFLAGALAAMVTEAGKIGFVGGMDIPVIHRFLAGYQAGAEYIDPECEVVVSYVGSWSDPETAKELAFAQYDQGADIVFGAAGLSGLGVIGAAKERELYAIGVDSDQRHLAPNNVLVSALKSVDIAVFDIIKETVEGDFGPGVRSLGLKENGVRVNLDNSLPVVTDEMKARVGEIKEKILSGEIEVP